MSSRRGKIIAAANQKSAALIQAAQHRPRMAENLEKIRSICQMLLQRELPLRPTARLVAQEGANRDGLFPAEQTIHNTYSEVMETWRKAHAAVVSIDLPEPIPSDDLIKIDPTSYEPGSRATIEVLRAHCIELNNRINALKQLYTESFRTPADDMPGIAEDFVKLMLSELGRLQAPGGFDFDNIGIRVTRRTPPGTLVLSREMLDGLRAFANDYLLALKTRQAKL